MRIGLHNIDQKLITSRNTVKKGDYVFLWYGLSLEVILNALGQEWFEKKWLVESTKKDDFLIMKNFGDEKFDFQYNIIYLGHLIYLLKDCEGFQIFINSFKTRNLEGCFWELNVAEAFFTNGYTVKFNKESGIKGQDYDLIISNTLGVFNVESKNRNNTSNNEVSLLNALKKAKKQLPKDSNGIIYISIPSKLITSSNIEKVIESVLRNTKRVKFIVLEWIEKLNYNPKGKLFIKRFRIFKNPKAKKELLFDIKQSSFNNKEIFRPSYWKKLFE